MLGFTPRAWGSWKGLLVAVETPKRILKNLRYKPHDLTSNVRDVPSEGNCETSNPWTPKLKSGAGYVKAKNTSKNQLSGCNFIKIESKSLFVLQTTCPSFWKHSKRSRIATCIPISKGARPHKGVLVPAWWCPGLSFGFGLKFLEHIVGTSHHFCLKKNVWNLWSTGYSLGNLSYFDVLHCTQFLRPGCSSQTKICKFTPVQNKKQTNTAMCKVVEKRLKEHVFFQKSDFQLLFHSNITWRTCLLRREIWNLKMSSCKFLPALPMFHTWLFSKPNCRVRGNKACLMLLIPGDLFATKQQQPP